MGLERGWADAAAPTTMNLLALGSVLALVSGEKTREFTLRNAIVQTAMFVPLAQVPAWRTGIMSWVDLAWPCGLVALGVQAKLAAKEHVNPWRANLCAAMYLFQGGRMAFGAMQMVRAGHMSRELPRYLFQLLRWEAQGIKKGTWQFTLMMQKEIFMQAIANIGTQAIPAAIIACESGPESLRPSEFLAVLLWGIGYWFEHTSDLQKLAFMQRCKAHGLRGQCCNEGFWSASRHPNYFGEWMVWCALSALCLPTALSLAKAKKEEKRPDSSVFRKKMLPYLLFAPPLAMYLCLTWWTGAIPAEYYSMQKRPGYKKYKETVPMFFPSLSALLKLWLTKV